MSNLDNVYVSCPARMSDGRGNITDWTSHNDLLKKMKGTSAISYDFRSRLQVSGLKDIENTRFNLCEKDPAGEIVLKEMKLNVNTSGSFLDAFAPLSKNSFFDKDRTMKSTKQKMVGSSGGIPHKPGTIDVFIKQTEKNDILKRIIAGEEKYKDSEPPEHYKDAPPGYVGLLPIYKRNFPAEYYRMLLVTEPEDEHDLDRVGRYIIGLIEPISLRDKIDFMVRREWASYMD